LKAKAGITVICIALIPLAIFLNAFPVRGARYEYWKVPGLSSPYDVTMDENGYVWFTEYRSGEIGRFKNGEFIEYRVLNPGQPRGIAYDGEKIWYADAYRSVVGYTLAGSPTIFSEFTLPMDSEPTDIAPYNSSLIWVTLPKNHSVALLNVSDKDKPLRIFGLPERKTSTGTLISTPKSIIFVEGSGCWYTDDGRGVIGQIPLIYSEANTLLVKHMREWFLIEGRKPWDIAADTYGRIWYTDPYNSLIGMLNPATNEIVEFKVPGSGSVPYGIAVDGMNHVWFTDEARGSLWRYDQETGTFTEFNLPDSVTPQFITPSLSDLGIERGPRDHGPPFYRGTPLWLTDSSGDLLIKFNPEEVRTTLYVTGLSPASPTTSYVKTFGTPEVECSTTVVNTGSSVVISTSSEVKSVAYGITETVRVVRTSTLHTETVTETAVFTANSTTTAVTTVIGSTVTGGTTTIMMTETYTSYITTINRTVAYTTIITAWNATAQAVPWSSPPYIVLGLAFGCLILALAEGHRSRWRRPIHIRLSRA